MGKYDDIIDLKENNEIGYCALEYDSKFQLIDNYFVIN